MTTSPRPSGAESAEAPTPASGRLLFVNQYYWPDHASTAQHLTDLAESLATQGYEVHVLCSRGGYQPGGGRPPRREVHHGVTIHRVEATSFGRRSTVHRMIDYLSFYVRALILALFLPRPDAVVTLTTPPIIGLVGTLLRTLRASRHVYWSMDLHPDASQALGRMNPRNPVVRALSWISDAVYRRSDRVVVLGSYMGDRIAAKGVPRHRLATIPVWSRADEVVPVPRDSNPLRDELGLADKFVVMYSGNLGLAHSFDAILGAAQRLRERDDVIFLFVGDGPRLGEVRAAQAAGLANIRLMDYFPRDQLRYSLAVADAHLISMRAEMTGIVVPGKLYGAMASGRPTVFVGPRHSESADTIRAAGSGYQVDLDDPAGLANVLGRLADDPRLGATLGRRGRAEFLRSHEQSGCCRAWAALLGEVLAPTARPVSQPLARGGPARAAS